MDYVSEYIEQYQVRPEIIRWLSNDGLGWNIYRSNLERGIVWAQGELDERAVKLSKLKKAFESNNESIYRTFRVVFFCRCCHCISVNGQESSRFSPRFDLDEKKESKRNVYYLQICSYQLPLFALIECVFFWMLSIVNVLYVEKRERTRAFQLFFLCVLVKVLYYS